MATSLNTASQAWEMVEKFLVQKPMRPLIVLLGATATGKTDLSIALSLRLRDCGYNPEIVNADSRQFYRGFDIGTAKIAPADMQGVPHHLLSLLSPTEASSIAWFQERATSVIQNIRERGGIPFLVGGSMLYVSSIVDGLLPMASDPSLRQRLLCEYDTDRGATLHARLAVLDPDTAAATPRENRVYVVRAMEIIESTGKPKAQALRRAECCYNSLLIGLAIDRDVLRERLTLRTKKMLERGWIDEVRSLVNQGYGNSPAMQSHGYREIAQYLSCGGDMESLREDVVTKGMQYAKRHQTWWKRDSRVQWIQAI